MIEFEAGCGLKSTGSYGMSRFLEMALAAMSFVAVRVMCSFQRNNGKRETSNIRCYSVVPGNVCFVCCGDYLSRKIASNAINEFEVS